MATVSAQEQVPQPTLVKITFPEAAAITQLSDNGAWAVACGAGEDQSLPDYPYLVDAATGELTRLWDPDNPVMGGIAANDVTDDGQTVVGSNGGYPAVYNRATGQWTRLPGDKGAAQAVTPDGRYIAGWGESTSFSSENYAETPMMWELTPEGSYRKVDIYAELEGFPRQDRTGANTQMVRIENMSADGNILAGAVNFIYPQAACYYVYNRTTHEYRYIDNLMTGVGAGSFIDQSVMSNNGRYLTGIMQVVTTDGVEYAASYRYDTAAGTLDMYNADSDEQDRGGDGVTNSGVVFASTPAVNPLRSVFLRHNGLWFGLDELLSSRYGVNFYDRTGLDYTGIVCGVSDDETVIACMSQTQTDGYIVRLGEPVGTAASHVNPLQAYAVSPAAGSQFARFRSATVTFTKKVTATPGVQAQLLDDAGTPLRQYVITANSDGRSFTIGGRVQSLDGGRKYTLRIPAGAFTLTQDAQFASQEISVSYTGRDNTPVEMLQVAPADGANVSELSTNNPVQMAFDMEIRTVDGAVGYLYEDGNDTPVSELALAASGNILNMSPAQTRYLNMGVGYTVVLPDSSVTDIMGDCGNREVRLRYNGVYEPQFDVDGNLFFDDFNNPSVSMATYLLYEGDHNKPATAMAQLGFDADNNPWNFTLRESDSSDDYFAGSHSMYSPAGSSDDWMSLPQLYIENSDYTLSFDAQSYRRAKADRLKVVVLAEDAGYSRFTTELHDKFVAGGVTIYDEQLSAGAGDETVAGEWQRVELPLAQFEGKRVYIAFVNQNDDQSMVFVDNIKVAYDGDFYFAPTNEENVVAQDGVTVGVQLRVTGADTYNDLTATLTSEDGSYTDTYAAKGLGLTAGSPTYKFEFPGKLPLTLGRENRYTISVTLDGKSVSQSGVIRNLAFETEKRVVVEEGTGQWCGNCPLGLLALDNMERLLGDRVIPIGVHGGTGFDSYLYSGYTSYLGYSSFPTGRVNRIDTLYAPMYTAGGGYEFNSPTRNSTFLDIAQRELQSMAYANVNIDGAYYNNVGGTVTINGNLAYALDMDGLNQTVAFVVVENGLMGPQTNYFSSTSNPNLGEFGAGGKYATGLPLITFNDVARRVLGEMYSGVSGIVPVSVSSSQPVKFGRTFALPENVADWNNAEVVVMLIDANTGRVVNAAKAGFQNDDLGLSVTDAQAGAAVSVAAAAGTVSVAGAEPGASVTVCNAAGAVVAAGTAGADGTLTLDTGGARGLLIARVGGCGSTVVRKVIAR